LIFYLGIYGPLFYQKKDNTRGENIVECIDNKKKVGGIHAIIGNAEFGNIIITEYCNDNNTRLEASVSKPVNIFLIVLNEVL
jgi:hypothetical protein